jgi:single-strand DNA-binding protein
MSVNQAILIGNLCADPEIRTKGGTSVANLRIATNSRQKKGDEWVDVAEYHSAVAFGKTAENIGRFCKKGKQLYIEGRIQTRKWTDKTGADRYSTEIVADVVRFLGGKGDGQGNGAPSRGGGGGGRQSAPSGGGGHYDDSTIPF